MPIITFVHPDGRRSAFEAMPGQSVMEVARAHLIAEIVAECGGSAVCATCHVYVEESDAALPPPTDIEAELLEFAAADRAANSRLSCQIRVSGNMTVRLPDRQT